MTTTRAPVSRQELQSAAQAFCNAFAAKQPLDRLLDYFSSSEIPFAYEHGLPILPFTGSKYEGTDGIRKYFETIASLLSYENMSFSDYIVDAEVLKVSVRGQARFTWSSTSTSWQETFTYSLRFDQNLKVVTYEVWADPLAAYLASKGEAP
ncbi:transcription elongation factor S-II [Rickenella mellea]|uniref:Transcription elongation factor S-II n=1 Tax=Rickenella mellea TaxID=50990 RepID=A0A4Y7Q694_9AGAM|nr:transcription elongation factor S-II [Rickenella mellea]